MALRTIRLFISSPGDVAEERLIARRLIGRLDAQFGGLLSFESVAWERAPLVATASFQEQLAKPSDSDAVIVILWSRLGTALPAHIARDDGSTFASGTEFEFEDAVRGFRQNGKPHILAYLKNAPIVPAGDVASLEEAAAQKRALDDFVTRWFKNAADGTLTGAFHGFATPADFEDLLETHLTRLAETFVPPGAARANATTWRGGSPFRGLQVFEPEHSPVFFGRTAATASVLSKLRAQGQAGRAFVLIVSMSGAGKSSLIRAGVLPLLLQPGVVGDATDWLHAVLRPADGQGLLVAPLARLLDRTTGGDVVDDDDDTTPTPQALTERVVARLHRSEDAPGTRRHLALVVDQLEEIFTDDRIAPAERDAFFAAIDALARSGVVWILSSMRSDAYFRIAESPTLVALKEGDGQFDLLPPTLREIGQIIRLPAAAAGLRFEARPNTAEKLDDVIRDASARNPGALPLLQFLLEELYRRRSDEDVLTFRAYEDLGGVEGALAQQAEKVLTGASTDAQAALSTVLRELVTLGADDESRPLRRVAPRDAFVTPGANELIDALLAARLLVTGSGADGTPVVSLAHEALLEFWPRMKAWVEEDRQLLLVHARVETATREWERSGRSGDLLLQRGKPLAEARDLARAGIRLSAPESALLAASQRRARRFALARGGAAAGLVVLTIIAGAAAWRARLESGRATVQATTAQRTTDFMVGLFANADPDQSRGDKVTVREVLDRGVAQIDSSLKDEAAVRGNLLRAMGQAYTGLGLLHEGRPILERAITESQAASESADALKSRRALATNLYEDGDYAAAETMFRQTLAGSRLLEGEQSEGVALSLSGIAESLRKQGNLREAESFFRSALATNQTIHGENNPETARDMDGLGTLLTLQGKFVEAEPYLAKSVQIEKHIFGESHAKVSNALSNLAFYYFQSGQYDRAEQIWSEALVIDRQVFGNDHAYVATTLNNLGRVELLSNHLDEAAAHMQAALDIMRKSLSEDHDDLVPPLNSLAMIQIAKGDLRNSKELLDEAAHIARERKLTILNQVLINQAQWQVDAGNVRAASDSLAQARLLLAEKYGALLKSTESWRLAVLELTAADVDGKEGYRDTAAARLSDAFPLLEKRFGKGNFYCQQVLKIRKKYSI